MDTLDTDIVAVDRVVLGLLNADVAVRVVMELLDIDVAIV